MGILYFRWNGAPSSTSMIDIQETNNEVSNGFMRATMSPLWFNLEVSFEPCWWVIWHRDEAKNVQKETLKFKNNLESAQLKKIFSPNFWCPMAWWFWWSRSWFWITWLGGSANCEETKRCSLLIENFPSFVECQQTPNGQGLKLRITMIKSPDLFVTCIWGLLKTKYDINGINLERLRTLPVCSALFLYTYT